MKGKAAKSKASSGIHARGFDMSFHKDKLPEYNPLHDYNLRHFFENKHVQSHLYANGLIDANGRVINLEKNKAKLHIIEQEFKAAERQEQWRRKEEDEFRHRVQQKRYEALEKAKQRERLIKIKEDRLIRQQILAASRSALNIPPPGRKARKARRNGAKGAKGNKTHAMEESSQVQSQGSFFVTDLQADSRGELDHRLAVPRQEH